MVRPAGEAVDRGAVVRRPGGAWAGRIGGVVAVMAVALGGIRGAMGLWACETRVGVASGMIRAGAEGPETVRLLSSTAGDYPAYAPAHYLLGSLLIRVEQMRIRRAGSTETVNLAGLDRAAIHLTRSFETSEYPFHPYVILGQGLLLGARLAGGEGKGGQVRPFAERAMVLLLRGLELNPNPGANAVDLWVEAADAGALSGRPDVVLYALSRAEALPGRPSPPQARKFPKLAQDAAVDLADTPLIAAWIYRRWRANPADRSIWTQMALLGSMPGGGEASVWLLGRLAEQYPGNPEVQALIQRLPRRGNPDGKD